MKKSLSILLATLLVLFSFSTLVAAEDVYPIVIKNAPLGHTYEAYQIFVGTLFEKYDEDENYVETILANIDFGTGISAEGKAALLSKYSTENDVDDIVATLTDEAAAAAFAKEIAPYLDAADATTNVCDTANNNSYTLSITKPGYYLVRDAEGTVEGENTASTAFLMKITRLNEPTVLNLKQYTTPTPDKDVALPSEDATDLGSYTWDESVNTTIGQDVTFHLEGNFPGNTVGNDGTVYNFDKYDSFEFIFHDTLSAGLTIKPETIRIFANDNYDSTYTVDVDYTVTVTANADGTTSLDITFADLTELTYPSSDTEALTALHVTYDATLNKNAIAFSEDNTNRLYLEYSNSPDEDSTGLSEEIEVKVYTYGLVIYKVDTASTPLGGAKFVILRDGAEGKEFLNVTEEGNFFTTDSTLATVFTSDATDGTITVDGLAEGTYYVREVQAPFGYNKIDGDTMLLIDKTVNAGLGTATVTTLHCAGPQEGHQRQLRPDGWQGYGRWRWGCLRVANNRGL
ncbi:MAG: isopeptide-forming domain-containing fimbrial protein, partial [Clostridia bacterium]|nr:isopeptide-forming domain-containing fimbrial protein [Clostridia bacterium]